MPEHSSDDILVNYRLDAIEESIKSINRCLDKLTSVISEQALQRKDVDTLTLQIDELKRKSHKWSDRILELLLAAIISGTAGTFIAYILKG